MLRVILVEDDGDQVEDIKCALVSAFGEVSVETFISESDFRQAIDRALRESSRNRDRRYDPGFGRGSAGIACGRSGFSHGRFPLRGFFKESW